MPNAQFRLIACFLGAAASYSIPAAALTERRSWTAQDSVQLTRYVSGIEVSADGNYFFFLARHGDVVCDCMADELLVYSSADVLRALNGTSSRSSSIARPVALIRRKSPSRGSAGIISPKWSNVSNQVEFLAFDDRSRMQLYAFDVATKATVALTDESRNLLNAERVGQTVWGLVLLPPRTFEPNYPVHVVDTPDILRAFAPTEYGSKLISFTSFGGRPSWDQSKTSIDQYLPSFSGDGTHAIWIRAFESLPQNWRSYDNVQPAVLRGRKSVLGFTLIDVSAGKEEPVIDAPTGRSTKIGSQMENTVPMQALWSRDGRHAILVNTALPLVIVDPNRSAMSYIVGYDIETRQWQIIEPLANDGPTKVSSVGWLDPGVTLLVQHQTSGKPAPGAIYKLKGHQWVGSPVEASVVIPHSEPKSPILPDGLKVEIVQGANEPPKVVASIGEKNVRLTSQDPALVGLGLTKQEEFRWQGKGGKYYSAGLLIPHGSNSVSPVPIAKAKRLPLVIQAYRYSTKTFNPDGPNPHVYAAQMLAARGIAVLNLNIPSVDEPKTSNTTRELEEFVERVDSAVAALAGRGLVDPDRVGLVGFSRGGFNTFYAITHPGKTSISAAIIDDAFPGTYGLYLNEHYSGQLRNSYRQLYDGTFWQNKSSWLRHEPSFNMDKVVTPTLFSAHGMEFASYLPSIKGGYELSGRPIEYIAYPGANHGLGSPQQRMASISITADWMSFWLQGIKDTNPAKAEQYARWAELSVDWKRQQAWEAAGHPVGSIPDTNFKTPGTATKR